MEPTLPMESHEATPIPTSPTTPMPNEKGKTSYGVLVALIIIVAIIIIGAFYLFRERIGSGTAETLREEAALDALGTQSNSTEAAAIEADLAAESPDDFDRELDAALTELDASFEGQ